MKRERLALAQEEVQHLSTTLERHWKASRTSRKYLGGVEWHVFILVSGMADYLDTSRWRFNCVCVSVCICVSADMSPYCSAPDKWLIMKLCMYHDANNVSNFGGDPVTQFNSQKF